MEKNMVVRKLKKTPPTQDDVYQVRYVIDADLAPNLQLIAYVVSETTGKAQKEKQKTSIWLVNASGGSARKLTQSRGNDYHPRFSNDGKTIYFLSTRDKLPQIYSIPTDGGEAEALTELKQGAGNFDLSINDTLVFATSTDPVVEKTADSHERVANAWYRFDPIPGYLNDVKQSLFVLQKGVEPRMLCATDGFVAGLSFSPSGQQIAYLKSGEPDQEFAMTDLCSVDVKTPKSNKTTNAGLPRTLVAKQYINQFCWNEAGDSIAYQASPRDLADQTVLFSIDLSTQKKTDRTSTLDLMLGTAMQVHSPARIVGKMRSGLLPGEVLTTTSSGGEAQLCCVTIKGKKAARNLTVGARVCHLLGRRGTSALFISQAINCPPELYLADLESRIERQITHENDAWISRHQLPRVERLLVNSDKGVQVEGWVMMPRHRKAPFKTVLTIHGGPHAAYGYGFGFDLQELVGEGYAVAFMNPRGSTGYGNSFSRAILGCWGDPELKDFNAFLDELIKRGISHPDKLAVTGISGGGHLSGWLIGHTHRFKAAVPEQGVYSMVSMWGTSDAGKALIELEMGGELHKIPDTYWARSPVAYAHKVKTPTLLIQGENDIRCPMEQAEQFFTALEHHGCTTELIRLKNCNHGAQLGGRPALRRYRMDVMKDWFARFI